MTDALEEYIDKSIIHVSQDESQKNYEVWAKTYNEDVSKLGFVVPEEAVKVMKSLKILKDGASILDVGAGTGVLGECLANVDFNGTLDLLDGSFEMLYEAKKKNIKYRNLIVHLVPDDGDLPLKAKSYDILVCVGSFIPGHIAYTALPGMLQVVKPGGYIVLNLRATKTENQYTLNFKEILKKLEDDKKVEHLATQQVSHFKTETITDMFSNIFVYRKL